MKHKRKRIKFPVTLYLYNGRAKQPEIWFANSEDEIVHWKRQYKRIRVERNGKTLDIDFSELEARVDRCKPKKNSAQDPDDAVPELLRGIASTDAPVAPVVDKLPPGMQKSDLFYDGWRGSKKVSSF